MIDAPRLPDGSSASRGASDAYAVRTCVRAVPTVRGVKQPTHATVTFQMSLQVTDPEAFLAWAATAVDQATEGQPLAWRQATRVLVSTVPDALRWAYQADPDTDPPGVTVTGRSLDVEAAEHP